ncbi:MAG: enoyl-CoA hydratase/isomerase family protein [Candidatus Hydrogenedentes bacterium]|nr:enoyl-CoA hydratase/isomerase family protein [Candidatus Hydrogenedentota bacterium]
MTYQFVQVETADRCAWVTLNRPKANALSLELVREIRSAVAAANADPQVRVILVTGGASKFFAAGADIPTIKDSLGNPMMEGGLLAEGLNMVNTIDACNKPVVAVVNGMALGGGCELALSCHLRIAADSATFGQPEINLGIIPGWGGTHRLPKIIGDGRARDWLMTGRTVSAQEALEAGLVSRIVPADQLRQAAQELADVLKAKPAAAMQQTLLILRGRALRPDRGQELEAAGFEIAAHSRDAAEGLAAFVEKRAPNFTGE